MCLCVSLWTTRGWRPPQFNSEFSSEKWWERKTSRLPIGADCNFFRGKLAVKLPGGRISDVWLFTLQPYSICVFLARLFYGLWGRGPCKPLIFWIFAPCFQKNAIVSFFDLESYLYIYICSQRDAFDMRIFRYCNKASKKAILPSFHLSMQQSTEMAMSSASGEQVEAAMFLRCKALSQHLFVVKFMWAVNKTLVLCCV